MHARHKTPMALCPVCQVGLNAATGFDHANSPKAGDYTICAYCRSVLEFDASLQLHEVKDAAITAEDREQIAKVFERLDEVAVPRGPRV